MRKMIGRGGWVAASDRVEHNGSAAHQPSLFADTAAGEDAGADRVPALDELFTPGGLATAMPFAAIAWDSSGRIAGWNQAAERLFGWRSDEAVGRCGIDLLTAPDEPTAV